MKCQSSSSTALLRPPKLTNAYVRTHSTSNRRIFQRCRGGAQHAQQPFSLCLSSPTFQYVYASEEHAHFFLRYRGDAQHIHRLILLVPRSPRSCRFTPIDSQGKMPRSCSDVVVEPWPILVHHKFSIRNMSAIGSYLEQKYVVTWGCAHIFQRFFEIEICK